MSRPIISLLFLFACLRALSQVNPKDVDIIRDQWGVPHIYAPTDAGVSYGLAWAHAEDDFETVQLPLLSAKQLLGSHLGKEGAAVDYVVSLLRLQELAQRQYARLSEPFKKVLHGYRDGINAFAEKYPDRVLVKNSFPVTEIDLMKAYGLSLSVFSGADKVIKNLFEGNIAPLTEFPENGSNAFALSREKTANDQVFLAVNSHQPLEGPQAWYEAHLISEEGWNMLGGLFPGGPVVFHGTNENLGWAHTVNFPDKVDIYQLKMNPADENEYLLDGEWKTLDVRDVKLKVKIFLGLKIGVKREVLWSDFGPVIKNDSGTFAFHLSTLDDIRAIEQWYYMNKSNNFSEFREALERVSIPGFNVVYADKANNIYHLGNAKLPVRPQGYDWKNVVPGTESKLIHSKYHTLEDLPQNMNPESGFVFNTNNSPFSSSASGFSPDSVDFPPEMGFEVWENNRSMRFLTLISENDRLFYDDFKRIKYDLTLPDSLCYPIDINGIYKLKTNELSEKSREMHGYIKAWNKKANVDALGAAQAKMFYKFLSDEIKVPYKSYRRATKSEMIAALEKTYDYFMEHFGRTNIRLGEFQFLVRGDKIYPIQGIDDVLAAIKSAPFKDGKYKAIAGESYIMMVRYPENGYPEIETVNVFGASHQPDSPHYDDQMELFINQKLKPMTLDIEEVRKTAEEIYHPE